MNATARTRNEFVAPSSVSRNICYGDRIFVRLTSGCRTLLELTVSRVNDLTELLGELRKNAKGFRGLATMYIRNMSRGWSMERPLMLYPSSAAQSPSPRPVARMTMPWETH